MPQTHPAVIFGHTPPSSFSSGSVLTTPHGSNQPSVLHQDIERVLIDAGSLRQRVCELGQIVTEEYEDKKPLLISVLKGSFVFMADLVRAVKIPHEVDFMATSSYGRGTTSSGAVQILKDLTTSVENRHVLIVEDIIDSGRTLSYLLRIMYERQPASMRIMTLLDKPERREVDIPVDWVGFSIPNEFVVGYGLDYGEIYRNLPYIGVLKPSVYTDE